METDTSAFICGILCGTLVAVVLFFTFGTFIYVSDIGELGNAICTENGQGKFISYYDKIVKCESPTKTIKYDGIRIEVGE